MTAIDVSIIVVCRNEARYISDCLESVISQFDNNDSWELIIVDGESDDATLTIVYKIIQNRNVNCTIISNPLKTLASGWNLGILNSKGKYVIRPDAHALLLPGYISNALARLKTIPDAGVVGGILETRTSTPKGRLIKEALSMRTGVGNSSFRTGESSGFKDTAVYGLYRREVFDAVGLFNEKLIRHQDTEFHYRMLRNGLKIFMDRDCKAVYFCRDTFTGLFKQMFTIGFYFSALIKVKAVGSLRIRHWVPMFFYLFLAALLMAGLGNSLMMQIFYTFTLLYLVVIFSECVYRSLRDKQINSMAAFFIIPPMHLCYASGTFTGILKWLIKC